MPVLRPVGWTALVRRGSRVWLPVRTDTAQKSCQCLFVRRRFTACRPWSTRCRGGWRPAGAVSFLWLRAGCERWAGYRRPAGIDRRPVIKPEHRERSSSLHTTPLQTVDRGLNFSTKNWKERAMPSEWQRPCFFCVFSFVCVCVRTAVGARFCKKEEGGQFPKIFLHLTQSSHALDGHPHFAPVKKKLCLRRGPSPF